jgi:hypothetical protein
MAKKNRKPNLPQETLERARRELGQQVVVPAPVEGATSAKPADARKPRVLLVPRVVNLSEEYAYVVKDMQNMGILASGLLIVLVILSFFI